MTNLEALEIARTSALRNCDQWDYLPKSVTEAVNWNPHSWVLGAMQKAYQLGRNEALAGKKE